MSSSSSSSSTSSSSMHEVVLAVYDLSRGMARSLSAQLLGGPEFAIDVVPHTGLVVYGHEYFFGAGAGIQKEDPMAFRRSRDLHPVQFISLGRTRVTQSDFEIWCQRKNVDGSFGGASYDLLRRNCNNFSDEAARHGLNLSVGVPDWILQVPSKFLSSPMGMMMRPMLETMQLSGPSSSSGASPFAAANEVPTAGAAATSSASRAAATATAARNNPWAHLPSPSASTTTSSDEIPAECPVSPPKKPRPAHPDDPAAISNKERSATKALPPVAETLARPLISADTRMVPLCLNMLKGALSSEEFELLEAEASALLHADKSTDSSSGAVAATTEISNPNEVGHILFRLLQDHRHVSFVLLLLRVMVLHVPIVEPSEGVVKCLAWIQQQLNKGGEDSATTTSEASHGQGALNATARAAAWLTLSNAVAAGWHLDDFPHWNRTVDVALVDWNPNVQPKAEARQAASGFLYNISLQLVRPPDRPRKPPSNNNNNKNKNSNSHVDDMITSILCFGLEGLSEESDTTCRLRRCMILGRLLLKQPPATAAVRAPTQAAEATNEHATGAPAEGTNSADYDSWQVRRTLAMELGIENVLTSLIATATAQRSRDDAAVLHRLAEELLSSLA